MSDDLTKAAPAVVQQHFVLPCAACGAGPAPDPAPHCWQCGEELKSNQENNPMKLKELITQLLSCDMNADVQIHAANGTAILPAMRISDCKERPEGDTTEPRVCIMCYDQEPATVEALEDAARNPSPDPNSPPLLKCRQELRAATEHLKHGWWQCQCCKVLREPNWFTYRVRGHQKEPWIEPACAMCAREMFSEGPFPPPNAGDLARKPAPQDSDS